MTAIHKVVQFVTSQHVHSLVSQPLVRGWFENTAAIPVMTTVCLDRYEGVVLCDHAQHYAIIILNFN